MADTNTYNKYNQPKKVISQAKFDSLDKTSIPIGSEYDIVGPILERDLDSNILTKLNNNAKLNTQNTFTQQQNFNNGIVVTGNITLNGDIVKTTTEELFVKDAIIHTRSGATTGLADNEYTGIQATKYDGTNDGQLVFDKNGTARVGDIGDTQPLATRSESTELLDNHLLKWASANNKLVDSGKTIDDFQSKLVSGTNIKTINGNSILGSGDLTISGGSSVNVVQTTGNSETDVMSQKAATDNFLSYTYEESPVYVGPVVNTLKGYFRGTANFDSISADSISSTGSMTAMASYEFQGNDYAKYSADFFQLQNSSGIGKFLVNAESVDAPAMNTLTLPAQTGTFLLRPNNLPTETSLVTVSSTGTHAYKKVSDLVDTTSEQTITGAKTLIDSYIIFKNAANDKSVQYGDSAIVSKRVGKYCTIFYPALSGINYFELTPYEAPTEPSVVVNATDRTPTWQSAAPILQDYVDDALLGG